MEQDFLKELGYMGFMARMKRLSDTLTYSVREFYAWKNFDIEPNWHLVFLYLKKHKKKTITDMAVSFGMSLPAVLKIIRKMEKTGYIRTSVDTEDTRKRNITLTEKALNRLPEFEEIWSAGEQSVAEFIGNDHGFLNNLERIENGLNQKSFSERAIALLKKEGV